LVAAVDEHHDGALGRARWLKHVLEHVAIGVLEVDGDHVGIDLDDAAHQLCGLDQHGDARVPGLAQPLPDDRNADAVGVDAQDVQGIRSRA
jgi:PAS domain-containing protein